MLGRYPGSKSSTVIPPSNGIASGTPERLDFRVVEANAVLIPLREDPGKLLIIGVRDFADLRPKNRQICVHWPFFCGLEGPKSHKYSVHFRGLIEVKD
jgi:hypothetical protein